MITLMTITAVTLLFGISLLHIYWAFGGRWGMSAVVPEQEGQRAFTPGIGATILVAFLLATAGLLLLHSSGMLELIPRQSFIVRTGAWICAIVFALRVVGEFNYFGVFKKKRLTAFSRMDTLLFIPLCAFLSSAFLLTLL